MREGIIVKALSGFYYVKTGEGLLECKARDHYFPVKRPAAERSASWDLFVRDWAEREIGFSLT